MRFDARAADEIRPVKFTPNFIKYAEGSALIEVGDTKVICTASIENSVPPFLKDQGRGWITAEYSMLPRSTHSRSAREAAKGKIGGRTHEIQRLIGRSFRSVVDMKVLGERTVWLDCDVIQADGGTRTAAITGSFVALALALRKFRQENNIRKQIISDYVAAVSVGLVNGEAALDLNYAEDSTAQADMNVVMVGNGKFVEIQGTAEQDPFDYQQMTNLLDLARKGIGKLIEAQKAVLGNGLI